MSNHAHIQILAKEIELKGINGKRITVKVRPDYGKTYSGNTDEGSFLVNVRDLEGTNEECELNFELEKSEPKKYTRNTPEPTETIPKKAFVPKPSKFVLPIKKAAKK